MKTFSVTFMVDKTFPQEKKETISNRFDSLIKELGSDEMSVEKLQYALKLVQKEFPEAACALKFN